MRAVRKNFVVGQPEVAATGAAAVAGRDMFTHGAGAVGRTVAHKVGDDLAGLLPQGNPHPAWVELGTRKNPKLIEFEHVTRFGG